MNLKQLTNREKKIYKKLKELIPHVKANSPVIILPQGEHFEEMVNAIEAIAPSNRQVSFGLAPDGLLLTRNHKAPPIYTEGAWALTST